MDEVLTPGASEILSCKSCGTRLNGKYCAECGEKVHVPGEHSFRHFLGDVLNAVTFLDNKFLRTLRLMMLKTGAMSYQYINGRRVTFIKPMSMFFIANLIYFMFPLYDTFYTPLASQMNYQIYSPMVAGIVKERVKAEKTDMKSFELRYNQHSVNMAKLALFLLVVYFSIPISLLNYKRSLFFFDHLIVSLEVWSLLLLLFFVGFQWLAFFVVWIVSLTGGNANVLLQESFMNWCVAVLSLFLLFSVERETYKASKLTAAAKATALLVCLVVVVWIYRASLFFITLWTM